MKDSQSTSIGYNKFFFSSVLKTHTNRHKSKKITINTIIENNQNFNSNVSNPHMKWKTQKNSKEKNLYKNKEIINRPGKLQNQNVLLAKKLLLDTTIINKKNKKSKLYLNNDRNHSSLNKSKKILTKPNYDGCSQIRLNTAINNIKLKCNRKSNVLNLQKKNNLNFGLLKANTGIKHSVRLYCTTNNTANNSISDSVENYTVKKKETNAKLREPILDNARQPGKKFKKGVNLNLLNSHLKYDKIFKTSDIVHLGVNSKRDINDIYKTNCLNCNRLILNNMKGYNSCNIIKIKKPQTAQMTQKNEKKNLILLKNKNDNLKSSYSKKKNIFDIIYPNKSISSYVCSTKKIEIEDPKLKTNLEKKKANNFINKMIISSSKRKIKQFGSLYSNTNENNLNKMKKDFYLVLNSKDKNHQKNKVWTATNSPNRHKNRLLSHKRYKILFEINKFSFKKMCKKKANYYSSNGSRIDIHEKKGGKIINLYYNDENDNSKDKMSVINTITLGNQFNEKSNINSKLNSNNNTICKYNVQTHKNNLCLVEPGISSKNTKDGKNEKIDNNSEKMKKNKIIKDVKYKKGALDLQKADIYKETKKGVFLNSTSFKEINQKIIKNNRTNLMKEKAKMKELKIEKSKKKKNKKALFIETNKNILKSSERPMFSNSSIKDTPVDKKFVNKIEIENLISKKEIKRKNLNLVKGIINKDKDENKNDKENDNENTHKLNSSKLAKKSNHNRNIEQNLIFNSNTVTSLFSTMRDSNYYSQESENLSKYIKDYFKNHGSYPKTDISFYKFGRLIGKGAFGKVNIGLNILTGRIVAIKSFNKNNLISAKAKNKILYETNLMRTLYHPAVTKILETFETDKYMLIIMEYISGGNLQNFVKKRRKLCEKTARILFRQLIQGIKYIHSKGICHRDIKLENILLDLNNIVKICDFGVGKLVEKGEKLSDQCGTPVYMAPEIISGKAYDGFLVDIWSAGVALYIMLSGNIPFNKDKNHDLQDAIVELPYKKISDISDEANNLLEKILEKNPNKRYTANQILDHPWMNQSGLSEEGCTDYDLEIKNVNKYHLFTNAESILLAKTHIDYRKAPKEDLAEIFTIKNLYTIEEKKINKNVDTKSFILAPYNSMISESEEEEEVRDYKDKKYKEILKLKAQKYYKMSSNPSDILDNFDLDLEIKNNAIKFHGKIKEFNMNYELNNNGEIDNGMLINSKDELKEDKIENYVKIDKNDKKVKDNKLNHNSTSFYNQPHINDYFIKMVSKLGYDEEFVIKSLKNNELNHATAVYYLFSNYENVK